jgi:hypothetical protein
MPTKTTKENNEKVLIKFDLPIEIPPKLKISPITEIANDTQKTIFTHEVWQLRPSKVPDNNCVPKKIANAQLMRALKKDIDVFSVMRKSSF